MQISKIVFLIFSTALFISCGGSEDRSGSKLPDHTFKDHFTSEQTSSEYLIESSEKNLVMKISGSLDMNIHFKELKRAPRGRKCYYHIDIKKQTQVHFQSKNSHNFFDFTIDGNPLEYKFLPGGEILFYIPPNSKVLKLSLKEEFLKKYPLLLYTTKKGKKCKYYRKDGTARVPLRVLPQGEYERFIAVNYKFSVQPSFLK